MKNKCCPLTNLAMSGLYLWSVLKLLISVNADLADKSYQRIMGLFSLRIFRQSAREGHLPQRPTAGDATHYCLWRQQLKLPSGTAVHREYMSYMSRRLTASANGPSPHMLTKARLWSGLLFIYV